MSARLAAFNNRLEHVNIYLPDSAIFIVEVKTNPGPQRRLRQPE